MNEVIVDGHAYGQPLKVVWKVIVNDLDNAGRIATCTVPAAEAGWSGCCTEDAPFGTRQVVAVAAPPEVGQGAVEDAVNRGWGRVGCKDMMYVEYRDLLQ